MQVLIILNFTSCAVRYGVVVGVQNASYDESASAVLGGANLDNYSNSTTGFHIGLSEESKHFITKLTYFQNSYPEKAYVAQGQEFDTALNESGFRGTLAWKLWFFQPYISTTAYNREYSIGEDVTSSSSSAIGFGMDLEYELNSRTLMYCGFGSDNQVGTANVGGNTYITSIDSSTIYFGLRYNFSDPVTSSSRK